MKVSDLRLAELLDLPDEGGLMTFAGQRALLFDAAAMGLLRKELIDSLGLETARCLLTRFGYAHGWRSAEALSIAIPWDGPRDWQQAGSWVHMLLGMVEVEPVPRAEGERAPFAECYWRRSYEAEQHRAQVGPATAPTCWTLAGFASGYLSRVQGRDVICVETRCAGCGDALCQLRGEFADDWGDRLDEVRAAYEWSGLDQQLQQVTQTLRDAERRLQRTREELAAADPLAATGLVVRSKAMRDVVALAQRVAPHDSTVLLTGPSGTGKERVARLIHERSPRAEGPFVAVNCAAVTESLLESELFGHVAGAFSGATADRVGLFEAASRGTLLLDEVGDTSPAMQSKLLRALQEREIRPVGASASRPFDARILAATSRDLAAAVADGAFREDLLYRLRVIDLRIPPLRERPEDIAMLARRFAEQQARRLGRRLLGLTPAALDLLERHDWPGNVRELEHAIEHGAILAHGERIDVGDLPLTLRERAAVDAPPGDLHRLDAVERWAIERALAACDGHRERTAERLGIGVATLYRKLRRYRLGQRDSPS